MTGFGSLGLFFEFLGAESWFFGGGVSGVWHYAASPEQDWERREAAAGFAPMGTQGGASEPLDDWRRGIMGCEGSFFGLFFLFFCVLLV